MRHRTYLAAWAALTIAMLASACGDVALAADDCIAKPNKQPPEGSHWYYQTNRTLGRKCWYIADAGQETVDKPASSKKRVAEKPEPSDTRSGQDRAQEPQPISKQASPKQPVANARAELVETPAPQRSPSEQPVPLAAEVRPDPPPVATAKVATADPREWIIASRWLNPTAMTATAREDASVGGPSPASPSVAPAPDPQPPVTAPERVSAAEAVMPPAAEPQAAASNAPDIMLFVLAGCAFTFVVVLGGLIIRLIHARQLDALDLTRQSVGRWEDETRADAPQGYGRPPARPVAVSASHAPAQRRPQRRPFTEEVDELERLLESSRRAGAGVR